MAIAVKKISGVVRNSIKKVDGKNIGIEFYSNSLYDDANCISYWRFEGNSNDTKGAHNGTDTNITYGTEYGRFNQGALFNGSTSKIVTANNSGISGNAVFSFSIWVKPTDLALYAFMDAGVNSGGTAVTFLTSLNNSGDFGVAFSGSLNALSSGSIFSTAGTTNRIRRVEQWGTDVYRCSETFTMTASGTLTSFFLAPLNLVNDQPNPAVGTQLGFAAPQIELGAFPTSFIPTTVAAVSRAADVISASGALVSGLIGQTEGTIYAEFEIRSDSTTRRLFGLSDGTQLNRVFLYYTSNALRAQIQSTDISLGNPAAGYHKVAFAYQQSGVSGTLFASLDGGAVVSGTAGTFPSALKEVFFGKREDSADTLQWNARIRAAALYTTRLSNDQLAELTRL